MALDYSNRIKTVTNIKDIDIYCPLLLGVVKAESVYEAAILDIKSTISDKLNTTSIEDANSDDSVVTVGALIKYMDELYISTQGIQGVQ